MSNQQIPNIVIAGFTGDRSGSMVSMNNAPADGLFSWINDQKQSVEENSQVGKFYVSTFDDEHEYRIDGDNISDTNVTIEQCKEWMTPRATTKLYDSAISDLNRLIQAKQEYIQNMPRSLRSLDPKIVIVWACMTDGADNASEASMLDFKKKVKEAQNVHDIKCFFLGANQDAVMTGQQYGFNARQSLTFGSDAACAASALRSVTQVMREASQGANDIGFSESMRQSSAPAPSTSFNYGNSFQTPQTNLRQPNFTPPLPIPNLRQSAAPF